MKKVGSLLPLHEHDNQEDVLNHLTHVDRKLYFYGQEVCAQYDPNVIRSMIDQMWLELDVAIAQTISSQGKTAP